MGISVPALSAQINTAGNIRTHRPTIGAHRHSLLAVAQS
ncbi:hypothetical protein PLANPX_0579 [Lacipirellula parvula]|uniref:Uncharacterized protein n=1 Tax=Lacipirellula parvula TaxID=2650471 RepID=A0A5K7X581_9BACT|nr:hypothetical protein PLANPX_0579 [Lacipirellula parvula]